MSASKALTPPLLAPPLSPFCPFDKSSLRLVNYHCSCESLQPLSRLYFCRHCLAQRCPFCVSHEVDSHYCPNCLENMPSAEARLKKNRCANCFDCPACGHTLSTRATSATAAAAAAAAAATSSGTAAAEQDPVATAAAAVSPAPRKVFYLACAFCRWTTRDIGLPDQSVASGGWPEVENPQVSRLAVLQEHYRALAQREKLEKESKRYLGSKKLSYATLSDKYGMTTAVARRRAGLPPLSSPMIQSAAQQQQQDWSVDQGNRQEEITLSEALSIDEVEVLPEEIFDKVPDLCGITTLEQRMRQIDLQPEDVAEVFPRHKHLMIKRSQRCRKCEHNLSKPEYNPSSIKFKIQLAAYYHVPEIVIFQVRGPLKAGASCSFILKVSNPTQHPTMVEFLPPKTSEEKDNEAAADDASDESKEKAVVGGGGGLLRSNVSLVTASPEAQRIATNADCNVPRGSIYVPPRDDAAEFDEAGPDLKGVVDDKDVIAWRRSNKVGVIMSATVSKEAELGEEVTATFRMKFVYTNTISALEQREIQTVDVVIPITVMVGSVE